MPSLRFVLTWRFVAVLAVLLRLPLWTLPGLGRDEAAYLDWSRHGELAYAPLLQGLARVSSALPLPLPLAARLPSVIFGVAVLFLFDRLLRARATADRGFALFALAVCPWQTYAGAFLHPDELQLAAALGFAWAWRARSPWGMAVAGGLALWAKPSGLLVGAFAGLALVREGRRGAAPLALLLVLLALPLSAFDLDLLEALRSFARLDSERWLPRLGIALLGLGFLGGPALLIALGRGVWRPIGATSLDRALGFAFVLGFGVFAGWSGQVKANWVLPAALLLWPSAGLGLSRGGQVATVSLALLLSLAMGIGFVHPPWAAALEARVAAPRYLAVAGEREGEVSTTRTWAQRLSEYRSLDRFCAAVEERAAGSPRWLFSDDYGLAAQWAAQCPTRAPRLVLPLDPVYAGRARPTPAEEIGAWVMAVHRDPHALAPGRRLEILGTVAHPVTGGPVTLARIVENSP